MRAFLSIDRSALAAAAIATVLSGCPTPTYAPTPCATTADCGERRTCVSGYCSTPAPCGNGRCDGSESSASCPSDCFAGRCGDGNCDAGETPESCIDCNGEGTSRTYLVSTIDVFPPTDPTVAFGFDLDRMEGGSRLLPCTAAPDFRSIVTGEPGVDNQFGTIVPTLDMMLPTGLNGAIQEEIQAGELLYVIDVSRIDDFVNDANVLVHVALGRPATGSIALSGAGLAPGQVLGETTDLGASVGTIEGGTLRATVATLPLSFRAGSPVTLTLREVTIGGRIQETGPLTEGQVGGSVTVDDVLVLISAFLAGVDRATIEALVMPDLSPDAAGLHCDGISTGYGFESVTATLE